MMLRLAAVLVAVCFCTSALFVARADEHEPPTIAFLKYYSSSGIRATTRAIWDMFEAYGFINPDERAALENEEDIEGERINIFFDDAGGDLPTANVMVNNALDRGADIMLTISTPVSSIAAQSRPGDAGPAAALLLAWSPRPTPAVSPARPASSRPMSPAPISASPTN